MATDFEKLGVFYLGREFDPAANALKDDLVLYDSQDLTTHAVCVGMTGSGKTGLCLSLLEEAAIDGVPAICIDPKGDLGNLLLTFPNLAAADFEPWIDAGEAQRKGVSVADLVQFFVLGLGLGELRAARVELCLGLLALAFEVFCPLVGLLLVGPGDVGGLVEIDNLLFEL